MALDPDRCSRGLTRPLLVTFPAPSAGEVVWSMCAARLAPLPYGACRVTGAGALSIRSRGHRVPPPLGARRAARLAHLAGEHHERRVEHHAGARHTERQPPGDLVEQR